MTLHAKMTKTDLQRTLKSFVWSSINKISMLMFIFICGKSDLRISWMEKFTEKKHFSSQKNDVIFNIFDQIKV